MTVTQEPKRHVMDDRVWHLQDGLAAAQSGDWIFVAAGTYSPGATQSDSFGSKPMSTFSVDMKAFKVHPPLNGIHVTEYPNKTILSGDNNGDDIRPQRMEWKSLSLISNS